MRHARKEERRSVGYSRRESPLSVCQRPTYCSAPASVGSLATRSQSNVKVNKGGLYVVYPVHAHSVGRVSKSKVFSFYEATACPFCESSLQKWAFLSLFFAEKTLRRWWRLITELSVNTVGTNGPFQSRRANKRTIRRPSESTHVMQVERTFCTRIWPTDPHGKEKSGDGQVACQAQARWLRNNARKTQMASEREEERNNSQSSSVCMRSVSSILMILATHIKVA